MSLEDRTEAATPHKREEARKEGRVAKSADLTSIAVLSACLFILKTGGPFMMQGLEGIMKDTFSSLAGANLHTDTIHQLMLGYVTRTAVICAPVLLGAAAVGFASNVLQVGTKIATKSIAPQMNRLDPIKGLTRLISKQSAVELLKSIAKVSVIGFLIYSILKAEYPSMLYYSDMPLEVMGREFLSVCWRLLVKTSVAILVLAALDFLYQRYSFENSIKMTKQEVKEEYKRTEGHPMIKSRMRQRQREMARNRMMQNVPKADVVVVNPTHIAVALKYDPETMSAPMVVAKGQRLTAQRIRALAEVSGVPIVENKPVARLLYKVAEVGQAIPEQLYQAVAEILAFVYQMGKSAGRRRSVA